MVVPYVEAGHRGAINLDLIKRGVIVEVYNRPTTWFDQREDG